MPKQTLGRAVVARMQASVQDALAYKIYGRFAPRKRRLNIESAHRRSLSGAKGLRP